MMQEAKQKWNLAKSDIPLSFLWIKGAKIIGILLYRRHLGIRPVEFWREGGNVQVIVRFPAGLRILMHACKLEGWRVRGGGRK